MPCGKDVRISRTRLLLICGRDLQGKQCKFTGHFLRFFGTLFPRQKSNFAFDGASVGWENAEIAGFAKVRSTEAATERQLRGLWGSRGREFESLHPDQEKAGFERNLLFWYLYQLCEIANLKKTHCANVFLLKNWAVYGIIWVNSKIRRGKHDRAAEI